MKPFSSDIGSAGPGGNLNLLLAAAVAGAQTDDDNSSSDEDRARDLLTLDEAMELWTKHKKRNGEMLLKIFKISTLFIAFL